MKPIYNVRSSSVPDFFDCPERWIETHIHGILRPSTGVAHLGTSIHYGTALFDQARIDSSIFKVSDACDAFVDRLRHPEEEVIWTADMGRKAAEKTGLQLVRRYCAEFSPRMRFTAVELQCDPIQIEFERCILRLTGQLDRGYLNVPPHLRQLVRSLDELDEQQLATCGEGIADLKSGKNAVSAAGKVVVDKHIYQLAQYELLRILVEQTTAREITAPALIIGMKTSGKPQIAVGTVNSPSTVLLGGVDWRGQRRIGLLQQMADMIVTGNYYGNPRSQLCTENYCANHSTCFWRRAEESTAIEYTIDDEVTDHEQR